MELIVPREWFDDPNDLVVGRYMRIISGLFPAFSGARKIVGLDRERSVVILEDSERTFLHLED